MTGLRADTLHVALDGTAVLKGVTLEVAPGEVLGIVGPNGAGKTTLLRALAGLAERQAGDITLDGKPLDLLDPRGRARRIAYLGQDDSAGWAVTAETLVGLGRLPHLDPWRGPGPADRAAVDAALAACDVDQLRHRPVNRLSGGERARVMLARALAVQPDILLADEPIAGLDPAHGLQVMDTLAAMAAQGTGVVVVLHDLTVAARACRRLVLLHDGRIAAEGPPRSVLTPENLATYYGIHAHAGEAGGKPFIIPLLRHDGGPRS